MVTQVAIKIVLVKASVPQWWMPDYSHFPRELLTEGAP